MNRMGITRSWLYGQDLVIPIIHLIHRFGFTPWGSTMGQPPHQEISSSGGTSISSETYFPFFLRCRTHSVRRYSICPLTDRKSSSAQAAIASYSFGESLSGTCFLVLSAMINTDFLSLRRAVHHDFRIIPPEGWKP